MSDRRSKDRRSRSVIVFRDRIAIGDRNLLNHFEYDDVTQHDELEPNLKKIPHRNGIWGLEAIVM